MCSFTFMSQTNLYKPLTIALSLYTVYTYAHTLTVRGTYACMSQKLNAPCA